MNYKRLSGLFTLIFILAFPLPAATISFLMVETGLDEGAQTTQYGSIWEGGLMEVFFNAGFIVTNSPIARMENIPEYFNGELQAYLDDAIMGGAEFFILGFLEYDSQERNSSLLGIKIEIYHGRDQTQIFEQYFPAGTGRNTNEEFQLAQSAGRVLVSFIGNI